LEEILGGILGYGLKEGYSTGFGGNLTGPFWAWKTLPIENFNFGRGAYTKGC